MITISSAVLYSILGGAPLCPPSPTGICGPAFDGGNRLRISVAEASPDGRGGDDPAQVGRWLPPQKWPVIAIHAALLPSGHVLHYSYPAGGPGSAAVVWEPGSNQFREAALDTDIFCSGLSHLGDGNLFVTGGNDYGCSFQGRNVTNQFDPFLRSWVPSPSMQEYRWYPGNATLGDGSVIIVSGLNQICELTPVMERFVPGTGVQVVPNGERFMSLYPRMHVLGFGGIAHVGPEQETFVWNPISEFWQFVATTNEGNRGEGTSVLLPGRPDQVMIIGGYDRDSPTATCEIIDFNLDFPQWNYTGSLNIARAHANAVILPDQTVMLVGGGQEGFYGQPVRTPELFVPQAASWRELPPQVYSRMYHSTATLLPDGRVLSAGQDSGPSAFSGEIYEPAYLFRGPRPVITARPNGIIYGEEFIVQTPQADRIGSVALIRPAAVTHSVNTEQRYVGLDYLAQDGLLLVRAPENGNLAPPGYYLLFIVDDDGVPSEGTFVVLGAERDAEILAAISFLPHAGHVDVELPIHLNDSDGVEPRLGGPRKILFEVSVPLEGATVTPDHVLIECREQPAPPVDDVILRSRARFVVELGEAIADQDCCVFTFPGMQTIFGGEVLGRYAVRALAGDLDFNRAVTGGDLAIIKPHFGEIVGNNLTHPKWDFDRSGEVTGSDYALLKPRLGHRSAVCP